MYILSSFSPATVFTAFTGRHFTRFVERPDRINSATNPRNVKSFSHLLWNRIDFQLAWPGISQKMDALYLSWETRWCALWHSCLVGNLPTLQPGNSWERWEVTMEGRTKVSHLEQPALSVKRPGHASQRRNWGGICRLRNPTWSLRTTWRNFQPLTPLTPWGISSQ